MTDPAPETTTASLAAVLSHTTGRMLAPLDEMYALQDFLLGRPLMTHERVAEAADVGPRLLAQFPRLAEAYPPTHGEGRLDTWEKASEWCRQVGVNTRYGDSVTVAR